MDKWQTQASDLLTDCFKTNMGAPSAHIFSNFFKDLEMRIAEALEKAATSWQSCGVKDE